ncbi:FAD-binding and (Fe-S)-binding domain-containing protein [uncultured Tessaracoccus sp.]|uniref:FAD-binding and (Fe-S)-binding domain-containing protein n=1 Tax=uncultured Tessaracoccus sp. TaxID=905023 RepID=UPI00345B922A
MRDEPLWHVHHGTHTAEAIRRPPGTSLVIEDFSVPREHVGDVIRGLNALFDRHGMARPAITGHLTDCTLHFMLTEKFSDQKRLRNYKRFAEGFVRLVLRKGGVLKAQYGTGRAMAPFLERQVGVELYECMREIKHLFDPLGILNPGVIFGDVPDTHLANLKLMPTISDSVDRCIECGLCETACPSSELTLSARQRIVLQREIAARRDDKELLAAVSENFQYAAIDTCSTASMCQLACPLGVDTGELVRRQRSARTTEKDERNWDRAARNWSRTTQLGAAAMSTAKRIKPLARSLLRFGRERLGGDQVWMYTEDLPGGSSLRRRPRKERTARDPVAAYFPGCQQTFLGASGQGVYGAFNELCTEAGVAVSLLNASELCCGLPWSTRGMTLGQQTMQSKVRRVLAPRAGETVVVDSSSCTHALRETLAPYGEPMPRIVDVVDFVADEILPRLTITRKLGSLLLYPSCGNSHLDNWPALLRIADAIAEETVVPATWTCCGAHGDRGLLHPELPRSATRLTVDEIRARHFDAHASTTRTCEVALSRVSGRRFVHLLEVLARVHREG